jgi:hypothetical protein
VRLLCEADLSIRALRRDGIEPPDASSHMSNAGGGERDLVDFAHRRGSG